MPSSDAHACSAASASNNACRMRHLTGCAEQNAKLDQSRAPERSDCCFEIGTASKRCSRMPHRHCNEQCVPNAHVTTEQSHMIKKSTLAGMFAEPKNTKAMKNNSSPPGDIESPGNSRDLFKLHVCAILLIRSTFSGCAERNAKLDQSRAPERLEYCFWHR